MVEEAKNKQNLTHEVDFLECKEVEDGYYQVFLSKGDLSWKAGQHGVFSIPNKEIEGKDFRAFSFASTKKENHIMIGTRSIGEMSNFKKVFFSMKKGEKVQVKGPLGRFVLKEDARKVVFIALGIGVTPVRSILKDIEERKIDQKAHIIYSSEGFFMFKEEMDKIVQEKKELSIVYPRSVEETQEAIDEAVNTYGDEVYYYISGPPKVMNIIKDDLINKGIDKKRIMNDPFMGY
jgi:ferredoxin-NADP reductase